MQTSITIITLMAALAGNLLAEAQKTVKVFILAGQSNMVGHGKVEMGKKPNYDKDDKSTHGEIENGIGSLRWFVGENEAKYGTEGAMPLVDPKGEWLVRDDVFVHFTYEQGEEKGALKPSFGKGKWFGPEYGFGHVVGAKFEEPVLIIKTSWGGHSLGQNFRPPSSGPFEFAKPVVEKWRQNRGKHGVPKDIDKHIADAAKSAGESYRNMMAIVKDVLEKKDKHFPELKGHEPEIVGFGWHQGWNDGCDTHLAAQYETNMANFIRDVRKDLDVKNLPFVIATTGQNGDRTAGDFETVCQAQLGLGDAEKHPEFKGTIASVETRKFKRPTEQSPSHFGYHWNHNGETHWLIGEAMGNAMVDLLKKKPRKAPKANFELKKGQIFGYGHIGTNKVDKAVYGGGYSMYSAVWPLVETYPGNRYQTGLLHTWMFAQYDSAIDRRDIYSCIEGGLGWWRDTRFATETPKFIMGGVALKFSEWANGPGAGKGRDWDEPKGKYAIAQLSSRVLWPPDGLNLEQGTSGELFGYGYRPLPLLESKPTTYGKPVPTGDQCWTLFLNTENVKGPLTFFLPEFFSRPGIGERKLAGQFLDSRPSNPDRSLSMETQYIPAYVAEGQDGKTYSRIAPVLYPKTGDDTVLAHQVISYRKAPLWDAMQQWFKTGNVPPRDVFAEGMAHQTFSGRSGSGWSIFPERTPKEERRRIDWQRFMKPQLFDETTFGYQWDQDYVSLHPYEDRKAYKLPEYYRLEQRRKNAIWVPVAADKVPGETGLHTVEFPPAAKRILDPYVTPEDPESVWKSPGPVSGPHIAYPGDGSAVTYYWYRFADQPAIQRAALNQAEREQLQSRIELIHKEWTLQQSFIPEPTVDTPLAKIDPALIVEPPKGYEIGYVPIATKQEWADQRLKK